MAGFTVMNVNFCLHDYNAQYVRDSAEFMKTKILETQPDLIFIQGIQTQQQIQELDSILQEKKVHYSYYSRLTKRGFAAVMAKTTTFKLEILNRDYLNQGPPEYRRSLFNGLACVKLTEKTTNNSVYAGSWQCNTPPRQSRKSDEALLLTKSMKIISKNSLWLIGGCFLDSNANVENRFLVGVNYHQQQLATKKRLSVENVLPCKDTVIDHFPVMAYVKWKELQQ